LILDGFRTFEHSQYWPMDLNLLIGESGYVHGFNDAELRRSGTHTASQTRKRKALENRYGRPDPQATRKQVEALLRRVLPPNSKATLRTDEHQAYPRAIKRLGDREIHHETTSSKEARTPANPLFPANLADMLLRHSSANHKRETIAFSKRRQSILYRAAIWVVWRNYIKSRSENRRDAPPAQQLGIVDQRETPERLLSKRLFVGRIGITGWMERCYFGRIPTRVIRNCREHRARYAV
jgi:hypothetical protein